MTRVPMSLFALLLLLPSLGAQGRGPLQPLRITTDKEGIYEIRYEDLAKFCEPSTIPVEHLQLQRDGVEVPLHVHATLNGSLGSGDFLAFYASGPVGTHSKKGVYVLKLKKSPDAARIVQVQSEAEPDAVDTADRFVVSEEDEIFDAFPTVQQEAIRGNRVPPQWFWKKLLAPPEGSTTSLPNECMATLVVNLQPEPRPSLPGTLYVDIVAPPTPGIPQRLVINLNGKDLLDTTFDTPLERRLKAIVPPETLTKANSIQIKNLAPVPKWDDAENEVGKNRRNTIFVDRVSLSFSTLLIGPSRPDDQIIYRLRGDGRTGQKIRFRPLGESSFRVYDVKTGRLHLGRTAPLQSAGDSLFCCVGASGGHAPELSPLRPTSAHLSGRGAEWVAITISRFLPEVERLATHRRDSGLTTMVVEAETLYDGLTHGRFDPNAISKFLQAANKNWKTKPKYVLLVGDADYDVEYASVKETLPARLVRTDYNGASATDALYGDMDQDGVPDLAVGRFPARSLEALSAMIDRTIQLETAPEPGLWRRDLKFVAGEARFSAAIDALLERTFRTVLEKEIPKPFRISLSYASPKSPYFWPAREFGSHVLERLNEGCLAFTYVGHGSPQHFDSIRIGRERFPIMDKAAAEKMNAGKKSPIVAIIACWTGEYDRPDRDSISEVLMAQRGGPAAVISSSRISHPYPDALFGMGLARHLCDANTRLGDVLQAARKTMIAESQGLLAQTAKVFLSKAIDADLLVKDHLYLYNLFGDPALLLPLPKPDLKLDAGPMARGGRLKVTGRFQAAGDGEAVLSLDRSLGEATSSSSASTDEGRTDEAVRSAWQRANQLAVAEVTVAVTGETFEAEIVIPADLEPGPYLLRAYATRKSAGDSAAALTLKLE